MWYVYILRSQKDGKTYIALKSEEKARALEKYLKIGSGNAFLKKRIL
jgi:predicted GIY-YIG superfamily endonuclease